MTSAPHPGDLFGPVDYLGEVPDGLLVPPGVRVLPGALSHLGLYVAHAVGWRALRLDLHVPADHPGPHPVVVYAHGGSFVAGVPGMGPWRTLPAQGIAVASVDYRLAGEAPLPEAVEDLRAAARWARAAAARFALDPTRVAGWGSSAGGHLMAVAGLLDDDRDLGRQVGMATSSARLDAVVNHYAGTDVTSLDADAHPDTPAATRRGVADIVRLALGFDPVDDPDRVRATDPLALAAWSSDPPPFLTMHGDADTRVGVTQSRRLHRGLLERGVDSRLVVVPGAEHGDPVFSSPERVGEVVAFLRGVWASRP